MSQSLFDIYTSTIQSWKPLQCPENFKDSQEILEYQKQFEQGILKHMKSLEGIIIKENDSQDPNDIAIVDRVTPSSVHHESAPKQDNGRYATCWTNTNAYAMQKTEVLNKLTEGQEERKNIILERIEKR